MTDLQLGEGLALPLNVVTRRTAILGQTDTGKTSTAVVLVEEARAAGAQVVVIDPTGAWFGITSSEDGESAGVDMVVMGGQHGDVPLDEHAGRVVARLVADEGYSAVLDLDRPMASWAARQRFVADFLSELYERAHSQILVVIDESHRFAPQGIRDESGHAARCLGAVVDAVALARRRGIGVVLITQRLAKLHKDVLELCEIVIAHRLRGNNDRKALQGWIEEAGEDIKQVMAEVARLEKGVARVSAPTLGIEGIFRIRRKRTFDSSRSIDVGEAAVEPKARADVDLAALEVLMADAIERQKDEDPAALRRRIRDLETRLEGASEGGAFDSARVGDLTRALDATIAERGAAIERVEQLEKQIRLIEPVLVAADRVRTAYDAMTEGRDVGRLADFTPTDAAVHSGPDGTEGVQSTAAPIGPDADDGQRDSRPNGGGRAPLSSPVGGGNAVDPRGAHAQRGSSTSSNGSLPRAAAELAETLAAFPDGLPRDRLALLSGRKPRGGSWNTAMKALAEQGIVEDVGDRLVPTEKAHALFPDATPLAGEALINVWRGKLPVAAREIFDVLLASGPWSIEKIGAATGRAPRGGSWNTAIKQLKTSGLVVEESRGVLRANPDLVA